MLTHVEFRSAGFPAYESESNGINAGRFGKRLAEFLSAELVRRGESVGELSAEDWGWMVPVGNAAFDLWIGVGNYEEYPDGFLCFIEPHTEYVRKFLRRIPVRERVEALQQKVDAALCGHDAIREVTWSTYEAFTHGGV